MKKLNLTMQIGERWWGGDIARGGLMPLKSTAVKSFNLSHISTENQVTTLFISNKGRFVYSNKGFIVRSFFGKLMFRAEEDELIYKEGFGSLRGAFLHASQELFPANGKKPADKIFLKPQYSTWVALGENQTQDNIICYAEGVLKAGMPAGTLIIDNGWQESFGDWNFKVESFPDPKEMLERLSKMGFEVMLWVSPFVSLHAKEYLFLKENSMLIRNKYGDVSNSKRQEGADVVLDFSNPMTAKWFEEKLCVLMSEYPNIVGIKQDAGDPKYYFKEDITYGTISPNEHAKLWAQFGEKYEYNELRASVNFGGHGVMQRQMDKTHSWGKSTGLRSLIPCAMLQGAMGYPYLCADMVGGGQIKSYKGVSNFFKSAELFVRWAEVSALMPAMQFSYPLWLHDKKQTTKHVLNAVKTHMQFAPYIIECAKRATETGEPIVRIMEYDFPDDGLEDVTDQFMLGDRYLVAPVLKKRKRKKIVSLPFGTWKHLNTEQVYRGGQDIEVNAPLGVLPIFERM